MDIGYIRVSSVDQNLSRQLDGVSIAKLFTDKVSGKSRNRPGLEACLNFIREGDILHVHSIDRLARNLFDLQNILNTLLDKGVSIVFHKENLSFIKGEKIDPMSQLLLQMLGAIAEFERTLIKERQLEGISAAKSAGKKLGRPTKLNAELIALIESDLKLGYTMSSVARKYGVSRSSLYCKVTPPVKL